MTVSMMISLEYFSKKSLKIANSKRLIFIFFFPLDDNQGKLYYQIYK